VGVLLGTLALVWVGLWATSIALEVRPVGAAVAPDPTRHPEAIVRVYGANVWGVRGRVAIHTWIATKARGAAHYRIYQVIDWRARQGRSVLSVTEGDPAAPWFGSPPVLLYARAGPAAEALITRIHATALEYPWQHEYVMWPGPNSNSFTQWVASRLPELGLELPAKAIGKNWMLDHLDQ
jgi:hypothetical protein